MKNIIKQLFGSFGSKNTLGVSLPASKNTLGIPGGAIYELTVWAWIK